MSGIYRIHYIESDGESMPVRSDLCIMAQNKDVALGLAATKLGDGFKVICVKRTYSPSNVLNIGG